MLYASDLYQTEDVKRTGIEDNPDQLPDLVAELLCGAVELRLHRSLTSGYSVRSAELSRMRGKILLLETERKQLLDRGKVACRFEEITFDTPKNRYVLTALEKVLGLVKQDALAGRCRRSIGAMKRQGVSNLKPSKAEVVLDRFTRNSIQDRTMLVAAKLAHEMAIPNEEDGKLRLDRPGKDDQWLRALFEKAVAGFYKVRAKPSGWQVSPGKWLNWQIDEKTGRIDELLPKMKTDIHMRHRVEDRTIVIDTKFNQILKAGQYSDQTIRSGYLYQIYAYIQSQVTLDNLNSKKMGVLLHPSIGEMVDETVEIQGNCFRFKTVDLSQSASSISDELLSVIA